jgi:hypothetical protein
MPRLFVNFPSTIVMLGPNSGSSRLSIGNFKTFYCRNESLSANGLFPLFVKCLFFIAYRGWLMGVECMTMVGNGEIRIKWGRGDGVRVGEGDLDEKKWFFFPLLSV